VVRTIAIHFDAAAAVLCRQILEINVKGKFARSGAAQ